MSFYLPTVLLLTNLILIFHHAQSRSTVNPSPSEWKFGDPEQGPYIGGDILGERKSTKQGLIDETTRWPNATLVYTVSNAFDANQKDLIQRAQAEISSQTCIRFREKNDQDRDWVEVVKPSSGCSSYLGRVGGAQSLNVADACFTISEANVYGFGKVAHEFIHALGFHHEQTRTDRDDFVTILFDKIDPDYVDNFEMSNPPEYGLFDVPYDYGSIMHYPKVAFPAAGYDGDTIVPKKDENGNEPIIGQRKGLSPIDFEKLNRMYNCNLRNN